MSSAAHARWLDVWTRAVIVPAWRRAAAVWVGAALVAALTFGPNAMQPSDLTGLALHHVTVGGVLAVTWLLVFVPTARLLIRGDGASYLRSLPGPALAPRAIAGAALIVLQLPWLLLWTSGEGALGLAVVFGETLVIVVLARWRPPVLRPAWPSWRTDNTALRAIHLRALRRRAGDALVRGAGLAFLAGAAAGLFVRNNDLVDADAATVGASVMAVVLVPAEVGVLLVILATHRSTAWLAQSLGISRAARVAAVVYAIAVVQLAATAIAIGAAILVGEPDRSTIAWLAGTAVVVAISSSLGCARVLLAAEESPTVASRVVVGSTAIASLVVLCLGLFGEAGLGALFAACLLGLFTVKS
jgi:hypothetical protein